MKVYKLWSCKVGEEYGEYRDENWFFACDVSQLLYDYWKQLRFWPRPMFPANYTCHALPDRDHCLRRCTCHNLSSPPRLLLMVASLVLLLILFVPFKLLFFYSFLLRTCTCTYPFHLYFEIRKAPCTHIFSVYTDNYKE